ncbi:MAG TPA: S8/S53 family peptidase [Streptosporangiaceae bacterium]|nr:S8/S53 family peptidase [Streptosporangiaceae bacterium]
MTEETENWRDGLSQKVVDEIDYVVRAFRGSADRRPEVKAARNDVGVDHLYVEGQILVRAEYLERVLEILGQPAERDLLRDEPQRLRRLIGGVALLTLTDPQPTVHEALAEIDRQLGRGIATPDHVLTVAPAGSICPATEPEAAYCDVEPRPSVNGEHGGAGTLIYLADTGLLEGAVSSCTWLSGVQALDIDPLPPRLPGGVQPIPAYTGHGTFVAGVMRTVAPAAEIVVSNAFSVAGSQLESDLVTRLEDELHRGVDIFHLSIATRSRHDLPLIAFEQWLKRLHQTKGSICIAPAGNDGHRRPNWPAAFPGVIAVGALGSDSHGRASFSNFGGWVDVYAPGRDLVNAYATGTYTCHVAPYTSQVREFYGMAKWSGTSFSTPIVTGLIAARMSRTGENAAQAAEALLAEARSQAIPGVGPVLLPHHGGRVRPE